MLAVIAVAVEVVILVVVISTQSFLIYQSTSNQLLLYLTTPTQFQSLYNYLQQIHQSLTLWHPSVVCPDDLEVGNATVNEKGSVWEVGTKNMATCIDDYLFVSLNSSTLEVACTEDGWEETEGCLKGEVMVNEG